MCHKFIAYVKHKTKDIQNVSAQKEVLILNLNTRVG